MAAEGFGRPIVLPRMDFFPEFRDFGTFPLAISMEILVGHDLTHAELGFEVFSEDPEPAGILGMGEQWEHSGITRDGSEMVGTFLQVGASTWRCDKSWDYPGPEDSREVLMLCFSPGFQRILLKPWLVQVVAACQPHLFPTCGSDLKMSRSRNL